MEKLIKKILKEYIESSLDELMPSDHYNKQYQIRFNSGEEFIVKKFAKVGNRVDMREVGTYVLSKNERSQIENSVKTIMDVDVQPDLNLGIEVYRFDVDYSRINFYSKDDKYETLKDITRDVNQANLYLMDKETRSVGDILFFIVKDNKVVTTFLERSFNYESVKEKRNLDYVITVDEIKKFEVPKKEKPFDFKDWSRS
jgi:hypothetical protein